MKNFFLTFLTFCIVTALVQAQPGGNMMGGPGMRGGPGAPGAAGTPSPLGVPFKIDNVPLNEAQVSAFISVHQKIQTLTAAEREQLKNCNEGVTTPLCAKVYAWYKSSGLSSKEEASQVTFKVFRAYAYVLHPEEMAKMKESEKELTAKMKDPSLPAMAKSYMQPALENMRNMTAPEADVALVRNHKADLDGIIKKYEEWGKQSHK